MTFWTLDQSYDDCDTEEEEEEEVDETAASEHLAERTESAHISQQSHHSLAEAPLSATALAPAPEKSPSVIGSERAPSAQSVRTAEALAENIPPSSAAGTAGKGESVHGTGLFVDFFVNSEWTLWYSCRVLERWDLVYGCLA